MVRMMESIFPDVQYALRPGIIELRAGHPDLDMLPAEGLLEASCRVLELEARQALSYGAEQGPGCLIRQLQAWLARVEGKETPMKEIMVTGGASQALDMLCMLLTKPGDPALVQAPTYHLALRVLRDHRLDLMPIPCDDKNLRMDVLEETLRSLERRGHRARLLYLVSTFANPTGLSMEEDRRESLVALAERYGFFIVEDDVYHPLWYDRPPPPSLYGFCSKGKVVRLGSFSKIIAPGLRLGWMQAPLEVVERFTKSGVLDSGGGVSHFTAHVAAAFMEMGLLDRQVDALRSAYRDRRDALLKGLERHLPEECRWTVPGGGFFVWLRLPRGMDSASFLARAEDAGVSYLPGDLFYAGEGGERECRLNFTMFSPDELEEGTRRLGGVLRTSERKF